MQVFALLTLHQPTIQDPSKLQAITLRHAPMQHQLATALQACHTMLLHCFAQTQILMSCLSCMNGSTG